MTWSEKHVQENRDEGRSILLAVLFLIYLALLAWVVLWKLEVPWVGNGGLRGIKLVPFIATGANGASVPMELMVNVLLFVPFGFYLGALLPTWTWWKAAATIAAGSLVLEFSQYALAVASSDVTDLIVNAVGGLAGFGLLVATRHMLRERTASVVTRVCSIGTALVLLLTVVFVASPLRYAQRDVPAASVHNSEAPAGTHGQL